ncbi:MAG: hypothetical protein KC442_16645 [Thermomicrobiales bacterium]|nr:hypothetical protein [Thermomicrobiales bacterium]MCA9879424.1 hypothetical protein [Thermomicrobiales bacterium]
MTLRTALRTMAVIALAGVVFTGAGDAGAANKSKSRALPPPPPVTQPQAVAPAPWQPVDPSVWGPEHTQQPPPPMWHPAPAPRKR